MCLCSLPSLQSSDELSFISASELEHCPLLYSITLGATRRHYGEEFRTNRIAKGLLIMYLAHHKKKYYLPTLFGPFIGCKQILIVWLHDGRCQYNLLLVTNVVSYYVFWCTVHGQWLCSFLELFTL